ncbi:MAG: glycoside hydrolase family 3 C-terminal domain-containing protein [Fimbriimonas sp.]|nr:glycoside hydrolase family 3 C-terminal domain-containing protein [Fimbriimonas sp.]
MHCLRFRSPSLLSILALTAVSSAQEVYRDPAQPLQKRVDDIVSRMTLEQKIGQMMHQAQAIPALGIPAYDWWNEALHGIARPGNITVFPQVIGLGASFDTDLVHSMTVAISDEARARYNFEQSGKAHPWDQGLDFWTPNINIFRDPRWGRGQETYGEDPFLTGRMAVANITGMQGNDRKYLKAISTPKHYAVHSGPDPMRHRFNAIASKRDMFLTYLPAFEAAITEGHAWSIMSSYNRINGEPASGSPTLLQRILRDRWHFPGYVVSDCGAIGDIVYGHHVVKTPEEAAALAVNTGCDLECGGTYAALTKAVSLGLIKESTINRSVKRLMEARFRMGMFDPPAMVPWSRLKMSVVDSAAHRNLARRAAQESMVLLKNDGGVLPLRRNLNTIAVIGPNADDKGVLLGNYHGWNNGIVTPLQGIRNAAGPKTKVVYAHGCGLTGLSDMAPIPASSLDIKGEYFNNQGLEGEPAKVRNDKSILFDWADNAPMAGIQHEHFSVRWTGTLTPPVTGIYTIGITNDDGMRVSLDGKTLLDDWRDGPARTTTAEIALNAGQTYKLRVEFYNNTLEAVAKLTWSVPGNAPFTEALNAAKSADAIVMCMGISTGQEEEEHDRTDIGLPRVQQELIKAVTALHKPVVLVLINGGPISDVWSKEHVPAILDAWYPGEEGGNALADVLFGKVSPAGKLPVTIVRSMADLPSFTDYKMASGFTYRYMKKKPLYPFGYGLSYTTFNYGSVKASRTLATGQPLVASAKVTNTGKVASDEVVELYVKHLKPSLAMPNVELKAFKRIHLKPGETKRVQLAVRPQDLGVCHEDTTFWSEPEPIEVWIGGSQPASGSRGLTVRYTGIPVKVKP